MAAGRFAVVDPVIALTVLNGSLLVLLELWCNQPEADSDQAAGTMAEMVLHMLGLSPDEARDLAGRPLPLQREEDPVAHGPTGADCAPIPTACVMSGVAGLFCRCRRPQPQSWMGRWRGPRSMAFCR